MQRGFEGQILKFHDVSILTRPESRMQPARFLGRRSHEKSFNPHPARKPDATAPASPLQKGVAVSILTRPESRMQPEDVVKRFMAGGVSILTRPESRMQLIPGEFECDVKPVSILTRPESRMQPVATIPSSPNLLFQSSPGPKAGCNTIPTSLRH